MIFCCHIYPGPFCVFLLSPACVQAVAEVRGHPEDFIVLPQQSPGERGRRVNTKHQPALCTETNNQWNRTVASEAGVVHEALQHTDDYFNNTAPTLKPGVLTHCECSSFPQFSPLFSQQYRSTTLPAFKYYVTCACLIFCCIFIVQILVLPK